MTWRHIEAPRVYTCTVSGRHYQLAECDYGKRRVYLDHRPPPVQIQRMDEARTRLFDAPRGKRYG